MTKPGYFNRDISWLSFNYRVLEEASDKSLPIYERLRFLAIYSSNLDEFYKVRVAEYKTAVIENEIMSDVPRPAEILKQINHIVSEQLKEFSRILNEEILVELREYNIILYQNSLPEAQEHLAFLKEFFYSEALPYLQPVLMNKGTRPFMRDNRIYLVIKLFRKKNKKNPEKLKTRRARYALLKIPTNDLPRFITLPRIDSFHHILFLDDIIRFNLQELFPGYDIAGSWSVKVARNADLGIEDEFSGNLVEKIRKSLNRRKIGMPASLHYDRQIDPKALSFLMKTFKFRKEELVETDKHQNLDAFFNFPNPYSPALEWTPPPPIHPRDLDETGSVFNAIKHKERLLNFPYQSFDYVLKFFNEAATDPKVDEIKITQYRVARNSAIVNALIAAARNKKKVTVFVEVKARFDEEQNLYLADLMKKAGIKIIYSIPGLKVHAKMALVIRRAGGIRKRSYAYLSTGNFNEKTAKLYADHGFFTCNDTIINDLENLFSFLEDQNQKPVLSKLWVTQLNMKKNIIEKIDREIEIAKKGGNGYLLLKMNGLQHKMLINKLYEASQSGVKIDLIIRGICCLIPGEPYSRNIRVIRIVDSFLEHARVWVFNNNGNKEVFLSSADWMNRNINRRIEIAFEMENPELKQELLDILELQLKDNTKARIIDNKLNNVRLPATEPLIRSQVATYEYLKNKEEKGI
ncbi:MAG: polyphosphate kinase 1 [Chlorobi bacterium]|nr:polyphosphate kinase 1 [Chlorobiota bacterium]